MNNLFSWIKGLAITSTTKWVLGLLFSSILVWYANNQYQLLKLKQFEKQKEFDDSQINTINRQIDVAKQIQKRSSEYTNKLNKIEEEVTEEFKQAERREDGSYTVFGADSDDDDNDTGM